MFRDEINLEMKTGIVQNFVQTSASAIEYWPYGQPTPATMFDRRQNSAAACIQPICGKTKITWRRPHKGREVVTFQFANAGDELRPFPSATLPRPLLT